MAVNSQKSAYQRGLEDGLKQTRPKKKQESIFSIMLSFLGPTIGIPLGLYILDKSKK